MRAISESPGSPDKSLACSRQPQVGGRETRVFATRNHMKERRRRRLGDWRSTGRVLQAGNSPTEKRAIGQSPIGKTMAKAAFDAHLRKCVGGEHARVNVVFEQNPRNSVPIVRKRHRKMAVSFENDAGDVAVGAVTRKKPPWDGRGKDGESAGPPQGHIRETPRTSEALPIRGSEERGSGAENGPLPVRKLATAGQQR